MKTVHELNEDELQELRGRWFHQHIDDGSLEEVIGVFVGEEEKVPMDVVKSYYEGTFFVEEDFWCNVKKEDMKNKRIFVRIVFSDLVVPMDEELDIHVVDGKGKHLSVDTYTVCYEDENGEECNEDGSPLK